MPFDSYQLFLDEKSLDSDPRQLIGEVTFDGVIKAVIHSKDSGAETVGTMNFDAGGTYASSLQGGRAFEKKVCKIYKLLQIIKIIMTGSD